MRGAVTVILCASLIGAFAAQAAPLSTDAKSAAAGAGHVAAGRRVIRSDEIQKAGVSRLSDIFKLIDGWAPTTLDGFSWQASPWGLDGFQTQQWAVFVDGMRFDINLLGVASINRVPVSVNRIDSVEVVSAPQFYRGEFIDGGLIHIYTRRGGTKGFEIRGMAFSGNETGDPGPYRYTEYVTPNVDKIGPDYAVDGIYDIGDAYASVEFNKQRHYATDAAVRYRTFGIAGGGYPQMDLTAGSAAIGGKLFGGWLHGFLGSSEFEDFFFYKPYGREIPVVSRLSTAGFHGRHQAAPEWFVGYRLVLNENELSYRENIYNLNFNWKLQTLRAEFDAAGTLGRTQNRAGVSVERHEAITGYSLSKNDVVLTTLFADADVEFTGSYRQRFAVSATSGESDVTFDAMTAARSRLGGGSIEASLAYNERRPEKDGRIWFWRERGYGFLDDAGVDVTADRPLETARKITFDGTWSRDIADGSRINVGAFYRKFLDFQLEDQPFAFDVYDQAFSGPVHLRAGLDGATAGAEVVLDIRPDPRVELRTSYRLQSAVSGGEFFKARWDAVPTHQFRQYATYTPVPGFSIWARLTVLSGSEWIDYRDAEAQSDGRYSGSIDGSAVLDAAVEKWFWRQRVRGSLLFTDLLQQSPTYHPIGASFDFSAFVQLEIVLGRQVD